MNGPKILAFGKRFGLCLQKTFLIVQKSFFVENFLNQGKIFCENFLVCGNFLSVKKNFECGKSPSLWKNLLTGEIFLGCGKIKT